MTSDIPEVPIESARRSLWERVSVVWLIPVAALAIALGIAWQNYADRGPLIRIAFTDASGVRANETELRYRDVAVGVVEAVGFSPSLDQVIVSIRLDKEIAPFVDGEAQFWVVTPEVTAQGVSGLDTVLSGVFLRGSWDTVPGGLVEEHVGLENAPLLQSGEAGLLISLRASEGTSLSEGMPIFYKGISVGRVGRPQLPEGGGSAVAEAVIFEPYGRFVSTNTRFWDASGFSFSIGAAGAELDFTSLASLISGGITFDTLVSGGRLAADGDAYSVFPDEAAARSHVFDSGSGPVLTLAALFDENISGLAVGAPVELGGLTVGNVVNLTGLVDPQRFGDDRVRLRATLEIRTDRMGLPGDNAEDEALDFLERRVAEGLRARLATASILTGGLKVELVTIEGVEPAVFERAADPYPLLPTATGAVTDVSATAEGVLQRINDLPIEALLAQAIEFLENATRLVGDEELGRVPGQVAGILDDVQGVVGSDAVQALPTEISTLVTDLRGLSGEISGLFGALEEARATERLLAAVDSATAAAEGVEASVEGIPALVEQLSGVAARLETVPVDEVVAEIDRTLEAIQSLIGTEAARRLPESLNGALTEVEAALAELRAGGTVENVNATLASAQEASSAIAEAASRLPALAERLERVMARADGTLADYEANSDFGRNLTRALREVQDAASALESLARAIERRPNSLILGR